MTRLGFGDPQTWGGRHYDTLTVDDVLIEQMEIELRAILRDKGFSHLWGKLTDEHPEILDELLRSQIKYNKDNLI